MKACDAALFACQSRASLFEDIKKGWMGGVVTVVSIVRLNIDRGVDAAIISQDIITIRAIDWAEALYNNIVSSRKRSQIKIKIRMHRSTCEKMLYTYI